jgi:hypothetical protein
MPSHPGNPLRRRDVRLALLAAAVAVLVLLWPRASEPPAAPSAAAPTPTPGPVPGIDPPRDAPAVTPALVELAAPDPLQESPGDAPEDRRAGFEPGPRGRVVDVATGAGVAGLTVRAAFAGRTLGATTTGADGAFVLPRPDRAHGRVFVDEEDWDAEPGRVRIDAEVASGATALRFEVERIVAAPLHGEVLDIRTREPVPDYELRLNGSGGRETVVTDAEGRFASEERFEAGDIEIDLVDRAEPSRGGWQVQGGVPERRHEHRVEGREARPAKLRIPVGPTYRFDVDLPAGLDVEDFEAAFVAPGAGPTLSPLHEALGEPLADERGPTRLFFEGMNDASRREKTAPLRAGDPPWARFRSPLGRLLQRQFDPEETGEYELALRSRDGAWWGSATVTSIEGIEPEPVRITLGGRGALAGAVRDEDGDPLPAVAVRLAEGPGSGARIVAAVKAGRDGTYELRWIPVGDYELRAQSQRRPPGARMVTVVAGEVTRRDVTLRSPTGNGAIAGVLRSRTGTLRDKGGMLLLRRIDGREFHTMQSASYRRENGEYVARFEFPDLPVGRYELTLEPRNNLRWSPLRMEVVPPATDLEFVCHDDVPTFDLEVRAVDAETGAPVEECWAVVRVAGRELDDDYETDLYLDVPADDSLTWMVRARGYRIARGDRSALELGPEHRILEARLERGWGEVFRVTTHDGEPLAGVELFVDGEPVGTTDVDGVIAIDRDARPQRIELRRAGWHVTWGRIDPADESFGWGPETPVYMTPDE